MRPYLRWAKKVRRGSSDAAQGRETWRECFGKWPWASGGRGERDGTGTLYRSEGRWAFSREPAASKALLLTSIHPIAWKTKFSEVHGSNLRAPTPRHGE